MSIRGGQTLSILRSGSPGRPVVAERGRSSRGVGPSGRLKSWLFAEIGRLNRDELRVSMA